MGKHVKTLENRKSMLFRCNQRIIQGESSLALKTDKSQRLHDLLRLTKTPLYYLRYGRQDIVFAHCILMSACIRGVLHLNMFRRKGCPNV